MHCYELALVQELIANDKKHRFDWPTRHRAWLYTIFIYGCFITQKSLYIKNSHNIQELKQNIENEIINVIQLRILSNVMDDFIQHLENYVCREGYSYDIKFLGSQSSVD